jgi:hypothetical protein
MVIWMNFRSCVESLFVSSSRCDSKIAAAIAERNETVSIRETLKNVEKYRRREMEPKGGGRQ